MCCSALNSMSVPQKIILKSKTGMSLNDRSVSRDNSTRIVQRQMCVSSERQVLCAEPLTLKWPPTKLLDMNSVTSFLI